MFIQLSSYRQSNIRRTNNTFIINQHWHKQIQKIISYFNNGQIRIVLRLKNGLYHCYGAPAIIKYFENGIIDEEEWYKDGKYHHPGGSPAVVTYYKNGQIRYNAWFKDGQRHRPNGAPSIVTYFENGQIRNDLWF